jgi:MFS family permease
VTVPTAAEARPGAAAVVGIASIIDVPRLLTALLPVAFALYANFQGVQQILVPVQVEAIDPAGKIAHLAGLTMICSITGILGLTTGGAASDATRSRWGRRAPWLAGMAALSAALSLALGLQHSLIGIAAFYGALWFSLNAFQGALLAVVPDRVPASRRSLASSILAFAGPLAAVAGVNIAAIAAGSWGYGLLAAMLAATTIGFVVLSPEPPRLAPDRRSGEEAGGGRLRLSLRVWQSFSARDFALAYAFRVLMFTAQFSINNYLLYILQDHIGIANLPGGDARFAAGAFNGVRTAATIAAIAAGLWVAHRTERRRLFAQVYSLAMAAAMLVPVLRPDWPGMLMFAGLGGLAMGAYSTIDLDFMSRVLPDRHSAGRDLALLVMAGAAAQFLAPPLGGALIRFLGYDALFASAAALTLIAGGVTLFVKGVR